MRIRGIEPPPCALEQVGRQATPLPSKGQRRRDGRRRKGRTASHLDEIDPLQEVSRIGDLTASAPALAPVPLAAAAAAAHLPSDLILSARLPTGGGGEGRVRRT